MILYESHMLLFLLYCWVGKVTHQTSGHACEVTPIRPRPRAVRDIVMRFKYIQVQKELIFSQKGVGVPTGPSVCFFPFPFKVYFVESVKIWTQPWKRQPRLRHSSSEWQGPWRLILSDYLTKAECISALRLASISTPYKVQLLAHKVCKLNPGLCIWGGGGGEEREILRIFLNLAYCHLGEGWISCLVLSSVSSTKKLFLLLPFLCGKPVISISWIRWEQKWFKLLLYANLSGHHARGCHKDQKL